MIIKQKDPLTEALEHMNSMTKNLKNEDMTEYLYFDGEQQILEKIKENVIKTQKTGTLETFDEFLQTLESQTVMMDQIIRECDKDIQDLVQKRDSLKEKQLLYKNSVEKSKKFVEELEKRGIGKRRKLVDLSIDDCLNEIQESKKKKVDLHEEIDKIIVN